jgi:hypothetical protein
MYVYVIVFLFVYRERGVSCAYCINNERKIVTVVID